MASSGGPQKRIGPYTVMEKIGVGSFATVYKALHSSPAPQQIDAVVAIKAIERQRLTSKLQEAIESEIEIMEKIRHKNIVRLFGCQKTKQHIYLILEHCAGGDLHHYIRRQGTLSAEVARHFLRELAQGLEFLWRHALVHRDLKPHNLLLTSYSPTAQLKIADFGFARHLGEALLAETLCGSPLYMAPEILGHHKYDAKADLWSVGTILFEMLAGKPPFSGANPHELLLNIQRVELRIPSTADTTPEAVDLLRRLLRRKPTERISFQEFFDSKYLALKTSAVSSDEAKLFSDLDAKSTVGILHPVMEDSNSSDEINKGDDDAMLQEATFAEKHHPSNPPFLSPPENDPSTGTGNGTTISGAQGKELPLDEAWEFVEESHDKRSTPQQSQANHFSNLKPPLPPNSSNMGKITPTKVPLVAAQQKRKHALGRATTFAVQVGERSVHLAKLAERIVEAYEEFQIEESGSGCECISAAAAALVVESIRILTLALAAAEDAAEAARRKNRVGGSTALVQEIKAWLVACKEKAEVLLQASSSAGTVPNPKLIMYHVALGLGRRAAGRELLLADTDDPRPELLTVVEDYSLGMMLLQLLTVNNDLTVDERKQVHGFLALFHGRLQSLE